jgi:hypothetical protein
MVGWTGNQSVCFVSVATNALRQQVLVQPSSLARVQLSN